MPGNFSAYAPGKRGNAMEEMISAAQSQPVKIGSLSLGGGSFSFLAGLSESLTASDAPRLLHEIGASGIWEADAQGQRAAHFPQLLTAGKKAGLPVIATVFSLRDLPSSEEADGLLIQGRSMQDYSLLKELGRLRKPVILTRSGGGTPKELLMCGEYLLSEGNRQVIFCEEGTRTFTTPTGFSLDLGAALYLRRHTRLPIIADPGATAQTGEALFRLTLAAAAAGLDGVMLRLDSEGAGLSPEEFRRTIDRTQAVREAIGGNR